MGVHKSIRIAIVKAFNKRIRD